MAPPATANTKPEELSDFLGTVRAMDGPQDSTPTALVGQPCLEASRSAIYTHLVDASHLAEGATLEDAKKVEAFLHAHVTNVCYTGDNEE